MSRIRATARVGTSAGWVLVDQRLLWTSTAGDQWTDITPRGIAPQAIDGVFFLDETAGWAVLRQGDSTSLGIAFTNDAGKVWTAYSLSPADADISAYSGSASINFVDRAQGWLMLRLASSSNFSQGVLFRTVDGGRSWRALPRPPIGDPVRFTTESDGSLAGGPNGDQSFVTHDGGWSWQSAPEGTTKPRIKLPPSEAGAQITTSSFVDAARGWLLLSAGQCGASKRDCRQSTRLLRTEDAGATLVDITPLLSTDSGDLVSPYATYADAHRGFDKCDAPSLAAMQDWKANSPFYDANIYIGGENAYCKNQTYLNPSWVTQTTALGWGLIPTWVGKQAPCPRSCSSCSKFSLSPDTAAQQAAQEAQAAAGAAVALGLSDSIIYFDMEPFTASDATCVAAAQAFVDAWVHELHTLGFKAGVYAHHGTGGNGEAVKFATISNPPDVIWVVYITFNPDPNNASVFGIPDLPDSYWPNHQRIRQWWNNVTVTWGSYSAQIDEDMVDALVSVPNPRLSVNKSGSGNGTVTGSPGVINCGTTCSDVFLQGAAVTLVATASEGSAFSGWNGPACAGNRTNTCVITLPVAAQTVTAYFDAIVPTYSLMVAKTGAGTVVSSPGGISCGRVCERRFSSGTTLTLSADPSAGFTFSGWAGACAGTGSCTVTMDQARSVEAVFAGTTPPVLDLTLSRPARPGRSATEAVIVTAASPGKWVLNVSSQVEAPVILDCDAPKGTHCQITPSRIGVGQSSGEAVAVAVTVRTDNAAREGVRSVSLRATAGAQKKKVSLRFVIRRVRTPE